MPVQGPWYGKLLPAKLEWLTQVVSRVVSSEKAAGRMGMSRLEVAGMAERVVGVEHVWCVPQLCQEKMSPAPSRRAHAVVRVVAGAALVWSDSCHGLDLFHYPVFPLCPDTWEVPFEEISELQWLGSGAQGAVFLGKFRAEEVAIKKVRDQNETDIKHLRKLKHPNIIAFK